MADDPNMPMTDAQIKAQGGKLKKPLTKAEKAKKRNQKVTDDKMDSDTNDAMMKHKTRKLAKGGMVKKYAKGGMVKSDYKTSGGLKSRGNGCARRGKRGAG